jgi:short-subunit dehydrogenase involved in D-alanine esterification of teichoic acids
MNTTGNTVFITGGASGIGLALAHGFLARRNSVIVCGRNEEKLRQAKERYPDIRTMPCDIAVPSEVHDTMEQLLADGVAPNVLVNNAGVQYRYDFLTDQRTLQKVDEEIDINFRAVVRLTAMFLPVLRKAPESAVVNISSVLGIVPKTSAPVYCATKAAVHAFSKSLRYQLGNTSVKVYEVVAPLVDTDMTRGREDDGGKISPDGLAAAVFEALERDVYEIRPGRSGRTLFLHRLFPRLIEAALRRR